MEPGQSLVVDRKARHVTARMTQFKFYGKHSTSNYLRIRVYSLVKVQFPSELRGGWRIQAPVGQ
jgi:hypothetical protein